MGLILFIMLQPDFGSVVIIATCIAAMILSVAYPCASFYHYGCHVLAGTMAIMGASYRLKQKGNLVLDPFDDLKTVTIS